MLQKIEQPIWEVNELGLKFWDNDVMWYSLNWNMYKLKNIVLIDFKILNYVA